MPNYNWTDTRANYPSWNDVPASEQNQINALIDQYEQLIGYTVTVPDWAKAEMASVQVSSMYDTANYMTQHVMSPGADPGSHWMPEQAIHNAPWARYGLTSDDYYNKWSQYQDVMLELTGSFGTVEDFGARLKDRHGLFDATFMRNQMTKDENTLNTYGWLRYGLNYQQFQQQKNQWTILFGRPVTSDEEGLIQLRYLHTAQGSDVTAAPRQTLGQVEQQNAYTGISKSSVR